MSIEKANAVFNNEINTLHIDEASMVSLMQIAPLLNNNIKHLRVYGDRS